jgi:hypothetical protein
VNSVLIDTRSCPDCGGSANPRQRLRLLKGGAEKKATAVNGEPTPIVEKGTEHAAQITGGWADTIAASITSDNRIGIAREINNSLSDEDLAGFIVVSERALMHGLALGALDSAYEVETNNAIEAPAGPAPETEQLGARGKVVTLATSVTNRILGFSELPYQAATDQFLELKILTRRSWDALEQKARLRSFTIANASKMSMIQTAQRELARQVARGADLRDFQQRVAKRLESAGWTPANPSHVETIFRTNVQRSYTAGRVEHAMKPSVLRARPFWQVVTVNDGPPRQRATHRQNSGKTLRADNPIWGSKMMPWGFNCRCRFRTVPASYAGVISSDLEGVPDDGFTAGIASLI